MPQFTLAFGVPISAQSLGVMLCGTVLGARRGALAVLLFVALAVLGLPLLAGGRGGLGVLASPTGGFVVGFPVAAYVTGWLMERMRNVPVFGAALVAALVGGVGVLYLFGVTGMAIVLAKSPLEALMLVTVFLPGDALKAVLAAAVTQALVRARPDSVLSRG